MTSTSKILAIALGTLALAAPAAPAVQARDTVGAPEPAPPHVFSDTASGSQVKSATPVSAPTSAPVADGIDWGSVGIGAGGSVLVIALAAAGASGLTGSGRFRVRAH